MTKTAGNKEKEYISKDKWRFTWRILGQTPRILENKGLTSKNAGKFTRYLLFLRIIRIWLSRIPAAKKTACCLHIYMKQARAKLFKIQGLTLAFKLCIIVYREKNNIKCSSKVQLTLIVLFLFFYFYPIGYQWN